MSSGGQEENNMPIQCKNIGMQGWFNTTNLLILFMALVG